MAGDTTSEAKCVANGFTSSSCAWVVKPGPAGAVQWQQAYPGSGRAVATQVQQTTDGGYIFTDSTTPRPARTWRLSPS